MQAIAVKFILFISLSGLIINCIKGAVTETRAGKGLNRWVLANILLSASTSYLLYFLMISSFSYYMVPLAITCFFMLLINAVRLEGRFLLDKNSSNSILPPIKELINADSIIIALFLFGLLASVFNIDYFSFIDIKGAFNVCLLGSFLSTLNIVIKNNSIKGGSRLLCGGVLSFIAVSSTSSPPLFVIISLLSISQFIKGWSINYAKLPISTP